MNPEMANALGNVHGGEIMKLVDEAGGFAAMKHARNVTVTVAMDSMTFISPVKIGSLVSLNASVNWIGRTSIEVGVRVEAENVVTGHMTHTNSAYLVYVALDQYGQATPVPPLIVETEEERRRWDEGAARQAHRLLTAKRGTAPKGKSR
jgi:acyl-CoA hydrolase